MNPLRISVIISFLVMTTTSYPATLTWGPWSESKKAPAIGDGSSCDIKTEPDAWNPFVRFLSGGIHFFQRYISPVDGDRCSMAPTCSHYSIQALQKHGAFLGFMMSADRIVHEYEEQRFVPVLWDGMRSRFYDPVENNDFWFAGSVRSGLPGSRRAGE